MKHLLGTLATAGILFAWAGVAAAQKTDAPSKDQPKNQTRDQAKDESPGKDQSTDQQKLAHLGVMVEPLHRAVVNRLAGLIGGEYGVTVQEVEPDSPAAKAGLKQDDVIYKYDDQKIFNAEQLVRLVMNDKPGREVTLDIIRDNKKEDLKVKLGERSVSEERRRVLKPIISDRGTEKSKEDQASQWVSFDALTLTRVDDAHFKAQIKYRDDKGKVDTRDFQGTHDEIAKSIKAQKDIPTNERNHLLRAMNMPELEDNSQ